MFRGEDFPPLLRNIFFRKITEASGIIKVLVEKNYMLFLTICKSDSMNKNAVNIECSDRI